VPGYNGYDRSPTEDIRRVGSSLVSIGEHRKVLCGITVQIGVPSTVPNHRDIVVVPSDEALQSHLDTNVGPVLFGNYGSQGSMARTSHVACLARTTGNVLGCRSGGRRGSSQWIHDYPQRSTMPTRGRWNWWILARRCWGHHWCFSLYRQAALTVGIYGAPDRVIHLLADPTQDEVPLLEGYLTMVVSDEWIELCTQGMQVNAD
jgi:hypothetical protein